MRDLISRKEAIDALEREKSLVERPITETRWFDFGLRKAQDVLSEVPSAQPEYRLDEWCTDCKEYDTERHCCPRFNQVIRTTLNEMKSERKKGKWIYKNDFDQFFCSECGFPSLTYDDVYIYSMDLPNFCEDCGADMRPTERNSNV